MIFFPVTAVHYLAIIYRADLFLGASHLTFTPPRSFLHRRNAGAGPSLLALILRFAADEELRQAALSLARSQFSKNVCLKILI